MRSSPERHAWTHIERHCRIAQGKRERGSQESSSALGLRRFVNSFPICLAGWTWVEVNVGRG